MKPESGGAEAYDARTIALHWTSAALVLALWTLGQCIDFFPKGAPRVGARSTHIALGFCLAIVIIVRIAWRARHGARLPPAGSGIAARLATWAHYLLYALVTTVAALGITCAFLRGDSIFGLFSMPALVGRDSELRESAVDLHGTVANVLLALAALHAAAAVYHHRILRDGVLRRMWPRTPG